MSEILKILDNFVKDIKSVGAAFKVLRTTTTQTTNTYSKSITHASKLSHLVFGSSTQRAKQAYNKGYLSGYVGPKSGQPLPPNPTQAQIINAYKVMKNKPVTSSVTTSIPQLNPNSLSGMTPQIFSGFDNFMKWMPSPQIGKTAKDYGYTFKNPFKGITDTYKSGKSEGGVGQGIWDSVKSVFSKGMGNLTSLPKSYGAVAKTGSKMMGDILDPKTTWTKILNPIGAVSKKVLGPAKWKAVGNTFTAIGKVAKGGAMMALGGAFMQLLAAMNPFQPLMQMLSDIFGAYGAILSQAFIPLMEKLADILLSDTALELIQRLSDVLGRLLEAFMPIIDAIMPIVGIILDVFITALEAIMPVIEILVVPLTWFAEILAALAPLLNILLVPLQLFAGLMELVQTGLSYLGDKLSGFWDTLKSGLSSVINAVVSVLNLPIQGINLVIGAINKIPGVNLNTLPLIPKVALAQGGIVTSPTVALIGERGPEAVVPLSGPNAGNGVGGSISININGGLINEQTVSDLRKVLWETEARRRIF